MRALILENLTDRSGRKYNAREVYREVKRLEHSKMAVGIMGMPVSNKIDLKDACVLWERFFIKDNNLYGDYRVLDTPTGKILKDLIKEKVKLQTIFRAMGRVNENNEVSDLAIISVDIGAGDLDIP